MEYHVTQADRLPLPASYITEPRYLGYKAVDESQPVRSLFRSKRGKR
jgi:hypothetical protein